MLSSQSEMKFVRIKNSLQFNSWIFSGQKPKIPMEKNTKNIKLIKLDAKFHVKKTY